MQTQSYHEGNEIRIWLSINYTCLNDWLFLTHKKQSVKIWHYVNIRFIANVQLHPNTIVNHFYKDTLQQQCRYLYKTHQNFSTSYKIGFTL